MKSKGFTLIELLIVVAIIAILAAIAVPNFLEAQTRAKLTRSVSDMRTLAVGIESYAIDNNKYPVDGHGNNAAQADGFPFWYVPGGFSALGANFKVGGVTSPVAYLSNALNVDPFRTAADAAAGKNGDVVLSQDSSCAAYSTEYWKQYRYKNFSYTYGPGHAFVPTLQAGHEIIYGKWNLIGNGPDKTVNSDSINFTGNPHTGPFSVTLIYDATNGTVSRGDVVRSAKHSVQPGPYGVDRI